MKTRGPIHWEHARAWLLEHLIDADKQRLQKGGRAARRIQRKIDRLARRLVRLSRKADPSQLGTVALKFPALENGLSSIRTDLAWGKHDDASVGPGAYQLLSKDDDDQIANWIAQTGDWHSGYRKADGTVQHFKTPASAHGGVPMDYRFFYVTHTLPHWDTKALAEAMGAKEISRRDLEEIFIAHGLWCEVEGARLASCGAPRQLIFTGIDWHLEDGTVHGHARYLKSTPLKFQRKDGTLQPKSLAPIGRHKKGEHWIGGERLGLLAADGKLVTNPLGPALCSGDAWREENFPPPVDYGRDWSFLDRVIAIRTDGGYFRKATEQEKAGGKPDKIWVPDKGATAGTDGKGLGLPEDLAGCRNLRRLVRELAVRVPAFGIRRDKIIAEARKAAQKEIDQVVQTVAGPEIGALEARVESLEEELEKAADGRRRAEQQGRESKDALTAALADGKEKIAKAQADIRQRDASIAQLTTSLKRAGDEVEFNAKEADKILSSYAAAAQVLLRKAATGLARAADDPKADMKEFVGILVREGSGYRMTGTVRSCALDLRFYPGCESAEEALLMEKLAAQKAIERGPGPEKNGR